MADKVQLNPTLRVLTIKAIRITAAMLDLDMNGIVSAAITNGIREKILKKDEKDGKGSWRAKDSLWAAFCKKLEAAKRAEAENDAARSKPFEWRKLNAQNLAAAKRPVTSADFPTEEVAVWQRVGITARRDAADQLRVYVALTGENRKEALDRFVLNHCVDIATAEGDEFWKAWSAAVGQANYGDTDDKG